jgi:hypothetical protein
MSGVSADGQTDTISISLPDGVTVVNVSNARSTDTDYGVNITNQQNPIELAVNPDDTVDTVSLDVEVSLRLKAAGI